MHLGISRARPYPRLVPPPGRTQAILYRTLSAVSETLRARRSDGGPLDHLGIDGALDPLPPRLLLGHLKVGVALTENHRRDTGVGGLGEGERASADLLGLCHRGDHGSLHLGSEGHAHHALP